MVPVLSNNSAMSQVATGPINRLDWLLDNFHLVTAEILDIETRWPPVAVAGRRRLADRGNHDRKGYEAPLDFAG